MTGAPVGVYYLKVHANDDGVFVETSTSDNVAWRSFRLTRDSNGNPKITLIATSPCSSPRMCGEDLPNREARMGRGAAVAPGPSLPDARALIPLRERTGDPLITLPTKQRPADRLAGCFVRRRWRRRPGSNR